MSWSTESLALLGTMSNDAIGCIVGHSKWSVRDQRLKRGIAPANRVHRAVAWTPEIDAQLGQVSDCEIARRLGCHPSTVLLRRRRLGIGAAR